MKKIFLFLAVSVSFLLAQNDMGKAIQLAKEKKFEEARNILKKIVDENNKNAEAFFLLGKMNMALRNFEDASESFEEAVELNKGNSDYHFWLGRAYGSDAMESNFITKAILAPKIKKQFELAVMLDSNNIGARVGLAQFHLQAPGIVGGDIDKALEQGKILLQSDEINGRIILAKVYQKKNENKKADKQYELLLKKYGDKKEYAGIYNVYGYRLLSQGKTDEAIKAFKKQIEFMPEKANPYDSLGDAYSKAGKLKLAIKQYQKALEINPNLIRTKKKLDKLQNK